MMRGRITASCRQGQAMRGPRVAAVGRRREAVAAWNFKQSVRMELQLTGRSSRLRVKLRRRGGRGLAGGGCLAVSHDLVNARLPHL